MNKAKSHGGLKPGKLSSSKGVGDGKPLYVYQSGRTIFLGMAEGLTLSVADGRKRR